MQRRPYGGATPRMRRGTLPRQVSCPQLGTSRCTHCVCPRGLACLGTAFRLLRAMPMPRRGHRPMPGLLTGPCSDAGHAIGNGAASVSSPTPATGHKLLSNIRICQWACWQCCQMLSDVVTCSGGDVRSSQEGRQYPDHLVLVTCMYCACVQDLIG